MHLHKWVTSLELDSGNPIESGGQNVTQAQINCDQNVTGKTTHSVAADFSNIKNMRQKEKTKHSMPLSRCNRSLVTVQYSR